MTNRNDNRERKNKYPKNLKDTEFAKEADILSNQTKHKYASDVTRER